MRTRTRLLTAASAALILALAGLPAAAAVEKRFSFDASELTVKNLIGEVKVTGGAGSFEVVVRIDGSDADLGLVDVAVKDGDPAELVVTYPDKSDFVYPRLGPGSRTRFSRRGSDGGGLLDAVLGGLLGGGDTVTVSGSGKGLEVWADVEIRVPAGTTLNVKHGVGTVNAENVDGTLDLDTSSGDIAASHVDGALTIDTGSGDVTAADVRGALSIDTGSGDVGVTRAGGGPVDVDTGSGDVEISEIDGDSLLVDTGSGDVTAAAIGAGRASIDTGSGDVELDVERMGDGGIDVDTGSGRIRLRLPAGVAARVDASTGSGGIDVEMGDAPLEVGRRSRNELSFSTGGGGPRITLSTGSGGISIATR